MQCLLIKMELFSLSKDKYMNIHVTFGSVYAIVMTVSHEVLRNKQGIVSYVCLLFIIIPHLSCIMTKPTKWQVRPAKAQISLGICPDYQCLCCPHEESLGP